MQIKKLFILTVLSLLSQVLFASNVQSLTHNDLHVAKLDIDSKNFNKKSKALDNDIFVSEQFFEIGLEYPTNFGIHLRYLLNQNIYSHFGMGFMPKIFLNSFKYVTSFLGYLTEEEAKIISNTFENSLHLDFRLAWLPYLNEFKGGPYLEFGVSGIFLGSGKLQGSLLSKVFPNTDFNELKTYSSKTNSYNATVHIGYQIPFEVVNLNIEIGVIKFLRTNILNVSTVQAPDLFTKKQKEVFQHFLKEKGWIFPTISAWLSFSF